MGKVLSALLHLQTIERQLAEVKSRLRVRENAVAAQEKRIEQFQGDWDQLNQQRLDRRKEAAEIELDLREKEDKVAQLRGVLNTAKTNKEYAAVLTQINTLKADNSKLEDQALKIMTQVDELKGQADEVQTTIDQEQQRLEEIKQSAADEVAKLHGMVEDLSTRRATAAADVPGEQLALFERIAGNLGGDAMARIEIEGSKPPYSYICGGCFMSLNAEHANALRSRDEVRTCDSCGRILYLEVEQEAQSQS